MIIHLLAPRIDISAGTHHVLRQAQGNEALLFIYLRTFSKEPLFRLRQTLEHRLGIGEGVRIDLRALDRFRFLAVALAVIHTAIVSEKEIVIVRSSLTL